VGEASLPVETPTLPGREPINSCRTAKYSAGQDQVKQDAKNPGRTGGLSAGRVKMRQELKNKDRPFTAGLSNKP
jgi:hypothetical protein